MEFGPGGPGGNPAHTGHWPARQRLLQGVLPLDVPTMLVDADNFDVVLRGNVCPVFVAWMDLLISNFAVAPNARKPSE